MPRTVLVIALALALSTAGCLSPRRPRASRATVEERVQLTAQLVEIREAEVAFVETQFATGRAPQSAVHEARAALIDARLRHNLAKAALETLDAR